MVTQGKCVEYKLNKRTDAIVLYVLLREVRWKSYVPNYGSQHKNRENDKGRPP